MLGINGEVSVGEEQAEVGGGVKCTINLESLFATKNPSLPPL